MALLSTFFSYFHEIFLNLIVELFYFDIVHRVNVKGVQVQAVAWDQILIKCLDDLKGRYPRFSEAQIADKVGIPRATFNRLHNECKKPRFETFLKLILGSGNGSMVQEAMDSFDQALGTHFRQAFDTSFDLEEEDHNTEEIYLLLSEPTNYVAFILAAMPSGTTKEQIFEVLGKRGLSSIQKLVEKGILREVSEGKYDYPSAKRVKYSFDSIKKNVTTLSEHYKVENVGKERNYICMATYGLNEKGMQEIVQAHRELHEKMKKIIDDSSNRGNIPMFSASFCDSFTHKEVH